MSALLLTPKSGPSSSICTAAPPQAHLSSCPAANSCGTRAASLSRSTTGWGCSGGTACPPSLQTRTPPETLPCWTSPGRWTGCGTTSAALAATPTTSPSAASLTAGGWQRPLRAARSSGGASRRPSPSPAGCPSPTQTPPPRSWPKASRRWPWKTGGSPTRLPPPNGC